MFGVRGERPFIKEGERYYYPIGKIWDKADEHWFAREEKQSNGPARGSAIRSSLPTWNGETGLPVIDMPPGTGDIHHRAAFLLPRK